MPALRRVLALLLWMGLCMPVMATAPQEKNLWPDQAALDPMQGVGVQERGTAQRPDRLLEHVTVATVTTYLPEPTKATGVGVIVCPGGGYQKLAVDKEGVEIARWLNSLGIAAFVLKYRMPDPAKPNVANPVPLQDIRRALRMVRSQASALELKPDRIGVFGASAGGHLAATLSTHFDAGQPDAKDEVERVSCRPDFAILLYPVITFDAALTHQGSRQNLIGTQPTSDTVKLYSNETQVTRETPPTFIALANDDNAVPPQNGVSYYLALHAAGVPAELHVYRSGGHGFGLHEKKGPAATWPARCAEWMAMQGILPKAAKGK
jgi:acetyl esterase/lipase